MEKTMIVSSVVATLSGNLLWILGLVNLAWLLFKDQTLFSWMYVIICGVVFILSLAVTLKKFFDLS